MILSRRIALNGLQLDELYERIVIREISFGGVQETVSATSLMGGMGQRITGEHYETLDVTVTFSIMVPKNDLITRRQIYEEACRWAMQKGWLTVNFMPDRRLLVDKVQIQGAGDIRDWTGEYSITFKAYSVPFWQDIVPANVSKTGVSSASFSMLIPGQYRTVADVDFINTSGSAVSTFSVTVDGNTIALTGLTLANGGKLSIYHEDNGLLRIKIGNTSVYDKRTAASADDLYAEPGIVPVSMTAGGAGTLKVSVRGRYC